MSIVVVAHRAGNSLRTLAAAERRGADVVECDVHLHRGRLVVTHLKGAGPLPLLWDRWELVSTRTPQLELADLLEARAVGTTLMLDLKGWHTSVARSVTALLQEQERQDPVLACGRWWPSVDAVAELPFVLPVLSARNARELRRLRRRLVSGPAVHGVSVHRSLLDAAVVRELHRHVDLVMTWPVNDAVTLDAVRAIGVSGVISDEVWVLAELVSHRRDRGRPSAERAPAADAQAAQDDGGGAETGDAGLGQVESDEGGQQQPPG